MSLPRFALRHGRALAFISVALAVAGLVVARGMPKGVYPEVSFPREQVVASLAGADAPAFQIAVTRPLEAALASIPGAQRIRSRTIRGAAELSLFFATDTDMAQVHPLVLARLAEARASLPPNIELSAERVLPSGFPIVSFNVEGPYPPSQLYLLAEYTLRPALSGLPGVGRVSVQTSDLPETQVLLDPRRLEAAHLSVTQVAEEIRRMNGIEAVARLVQAHEMALAVVSGAFRSPEAVAQVVVTGGPDAPVRVADLGRVVPGVAPRTSLIRTDGKPGVILNVSRRLGGDLLALNEGVKATLARLGPTLPPGVVLRPVYEQADFVNEAVSGVEDALLYGALFAVLVIALFLRDLRATLVVALSVPLTLAIALLVLRILGQSLNLMTLGGLTVAVGLVIDDAVVIIEAIHAGLERGLAPAEAAIQGTEELFWPVVGTTATTLVVFLPLALLGGVAGQFFQALSLALGAAVFLSLPISLLVLPPLAARVLKPLRRGSAAAGMAKRYAALLAPLARHSGALAGAAVTLIALAGWGLTRLPSDFLPEADEGSYVVDYFAPVGASLEEADALAARVEQVIRETPEVESFSRRLGAELGPPTATLASRGDIAVRLKSPRARTLEDIMDDQRERIAQVAPGLRVELMQVLSDMLGDLQGSAEPIDLKIFGEDPVVLQRLAREASGRISSSPGLVDFFDGNEGCAPRTVIEVDPLRAGRQGLSTTEISAQLRAGFLGDVPTQIFRPDHLEGVRVRMDWPEVPDASWLEHARVRGNNGEWLPVAAISDLTPGCAPAQLLRENQRNYVHLTARLSGTSLGTAVREVRQRLSGWNLPVGYQIELGGLVEQQVESTRGMLMVGLVALVAVAGVLLFQLRSWTASAAVLGVAPFALVGGVVALLLTGSSLNVSSMMGGILLVGLVVKNGILLAEAVTREQAHEVGAAEPVSAAARSRLRPILMTTLATLVALAPLILARGGGAALHRPLAVVVLGGLAFSTAATLALLPVLLLRLSAKPK